MPSTGERLGDHANKVDPASCGTPAVPPPGPAHDVEAWLFGFICERGNHAPGASVVVYTSSLEKSDEITALHAGADKYMQKSGNMEALGDYVNNWFGYARTAWKK